MKHPPVAPKSHSRDASLSVALAFFAIVAIGLPQAAQCTRSLDPRIVTYPGDIHLGLIINSHKMIPSKDTNKTICSGEISPEAIIDGMGAIWAAHQVNLNQNYPNQLKIGIYLYDTCSSYDVAQRQTVRLLSHINDMQSKLCKDGKKPPLFGVVIPGEAPKPSVALLKSFQVPVVTTKETSISLDGNSGSIFSVSPSLKYMSKGVMSLLKRLNWVIATMVISDDVPLYYSKVFEQIAKKVHFNVVATPASPYARAKRETKPESDGNNSVPESAKNTILFLSPHESLQLFTSLRSNSPLPATDTFNWIVVTSEDIADRVAAIFASKRSCHTKALYLLVPHTAPTKEFEGYFQREMRDNGVGSVHPLIAQLAKSPEAASNVMPIGSVAQAVKAVWSLSLALRKVERLKCHELKTKTECIDKIKTQLLESVFNATLALESEITGSGLESIDGLKIKFDKDHLLETNRYNLKAISSKCVVSQVGYYDETGLVLDEVAFSLLNGFRADPILSSLALEKSQQQPLLIGSTTTFNSDGPTPAPVTISTSTEKRFKPIRGKPFVEPIDVDYNEQLITIMSSNSLPVIKQRPKNLLAQHIQTSPTIPRRQYLHQDTAKGAANGHVSHFSTSKLGRDSIDKQTKDIPSRVQYKEVTKKRQTTLTSWLGKPWALTILTLSIGGALLTLYVFTFLLMKACEGALRRSNQGLVSFHLFAVLMVFLGSVLYVFEPNPFMCSLRTSSHNISLALLLGSLLLRVMYLRAQQWIGLGGKIPRLNQALTLLFIFGIQMALELQTWKYESPWSSRVALDAQFYCPSKYSEYFNSQLYLSFILMVLFMVSLSARRQPFTSKEGNHVFIATCLIVPIFVGSIVLCEHFADSAGVRVDVQNGTGTGPGVGAGSGSGPRDERNAINRDILKSLSMIGISIVTLSSIFGPILFTIHKYGVLPRKAGSYADSLSTAFTMFRGANENVLSPDNLSHQGSSRTGTNSTEGQGSCRRNRPGKRVYSGSLFSPYNYTGHNGNFKLTTRAGHNDQDQFFRKHYPLHEQGHPLDDSKARDLIRNPLYTDQINFRSAYP